MPEKEQVIEKQIAVQEIGYWKSPMYENSYFEPYNPDDLVRKFGYNKGLDKYAKMKQDDAVKSALFVKKSAVVSSGWRINPASEDQADQDIADFVMTDFKDVFAGSFDNALMQILSAIEYGFSVNEKIYAVDGSKVVLTNIKAKPPQSFEFHVDYFGNLKDNGFKQWTADKGLLSLPLYKFIYFVHNREIDNWYGESDLRAAYRSWFSKDMAIKAWNIFLERCGVPLAVGKYDKLASSEDRTDLKTILDTLSFKTSITLPKDSDVEFKEVNKAGGDFDKAIDKHNSMIMRSILVPRHLGFDETNGGSYALGKVNLGVFTWVVNRLRNELEDAVNEQLVRQLVLLNYPNIKAFPKFAFDPISEEDKNEKAKMIIEALKSGAVSPDENSENFLRGLLGLPEVQKEEFKFKPEPKAYKYSRQPNKYEKKVDFAFIQKAIVDDVEEGIDELKDQLRKVRDDFTTQIVRKKLVEDKNVAGADQAEFRYIRELGLQIEGVLRSGYEAGLKSAKDTAKKAEYAKPISGQGLVKSKAVMWIKAQSKILTGEISTGLQGKAKKVLLDGIEKGLPTYDVINRIDAVFEPYVAQAGVQGSEIEGMRLYTEINTAVAKSFRTGIDEYNAPLEAEGYIEAYEFSAIIDDVTTDECQALDGLIFGVNNPVWDKVNPPIWWNCRSVRVPIFKGEEWTEDDVPAIVANSENLF